MRLLQETIQEQLQSIPLEGLLLYLGYQEHKANSKPKEWVAFAQADTETLLLVFKEKTGLRYLNPVRPQDSGDVMDFVLNHQKSFGGGDTRKGFWEGVADTINAFGAMAFKSLESVSELETVQAPIHYFLQGLEPSKGEALSPWGITEETLQSYPFQKKVFIKENRPCFPLQNRKGQVIGNAFFNKNDIRFQEYGDKEHGMWMTHTGKQQKMVLVMDTPLEAMSHYQLFPNADVFYVAFPGKLHREHLAFLVKLAQEQQYKKILLGFSNTTHGLLRDYLVLGHFMDHQIPTSVGLDMDREQVVIKMMPTGTEDTTMSSLHEAIKRFNAKQKKGYDRLFSLEHAPTLTKGIIRMVPVAGGGFQLYIPSKLALLKFGLWLLHKAFGLQHGKPSVAFVKSLNRTWHEDLMAYENDKNKESIEENMRKTAS